MSSDAKVWLESDGWKGGHDGPCLLLRGHKINTSPYGLVELLTEIEGCMGSRAMRWEFRRYPSDDDTIGLVGYVA